MNPWTHPQILRPAGVRNLDLSAPKSSTPATKPRRRSAEPSPEPKWTPGLIHRYYDPRGSGIWTFQPRKAQKADPRNKASQTFCGTFSGTKVNPWNHPQILRPAGVRNLDLSAPKSSKSGPPQQSLADVLRNLLRNQSEPLDSSTDTTTRGGPEFGPFSPEKLNPRNKASQTFCGTFSGTKVNPWTHPQILRPAGVRNLDLSAPKSSKADTRNKASQTFCGTFSGTKVNPWNHPQILRPAGVRNLDLSAPKSSKSGPPQQSLADVLRNLLRNQSEPLESSTDTTTRGGKEFGPFSPEKLKKRTPATKPPRRSAEPLRNQSEPLESSTDPTTRGGPEFGPFSPEKRKKRNLLRNQSEPLDSSTDTTTRPQQSLADVLRNLLRNQSEPLESSTDTTTRGGPEFGPFSPEKLKKRTPATKPPRRSAEPSPEPKWTPGLIHRYYDPRGSGIWTFQPRKAQKADPRNKASQTFCGTFSGTKVNPWTHPQILRPAGVRNLDLSAPKSSKSGPPQQSLPDVLCGTFSGTKVNPWNHPQILRPAGVRNLDLSAPKSSKSGPPQQSLADVLRNLLRNQSEPLDSSTDTTTRGGPEFGPFSPEKLKKRTPATKPPRRTAEPSPEPKWTPGLIHRYYDPRGSGIWTFQPRKAQKADPRNKASQTFCGTFSGTKVNPWTHPQILRPAGVRKMDLSAPKSSKSGPPQQSLPDVLRNLLRNQSEPLESSTEECIWEKAICPSARRMTSEKRIKLEFNSSDTFQVGWKLEKN